MKKLFLTVFISFTLTGYVFAQIPKEAFDLTNSLSALWRNGEIDKAVESSLELYNLHPPMFIDRIHNTLAQQLEDDPQRYGLKYLEKLSNKENQEINSIITPIRLWGKTIITTEKPKLLSIVKKLDTLQTESSHYQSRMERYCLLILKELDKKNILNNVQRLELINNNISSLKSYPNITNIITERNEAEKRAWHRYLLSYCYNYLYSNISNKEEFLEKASEYSPDQNDRLNQSAYFYDAAIITGNPTKIGFKFKYQKYLVDNNRESEALNMLSEITFADPSDNNIASLQELFYKINNEQSFNTYWEGYVHNQGKPVPTLKIKFKNEELDLAKKPGSWIYIDVWGTWCRPCRKELPELQSLYVKNLKFKKSKLKIYTLSYGSQNLYDFMAENEYTFPVSEIDQKINDLFEVEGYPTKILISPEGNFFKIPFGEDWITYIKNYTLM